MYRLTQEGPEDWWEVEALYDLCFAPGREALSSYRLRDGVARVAPLCLTARDGDGILVGAIRHWPVRVGGAKALFLGPIAVHPTRQGEGLGGELITRARDAARALGWERMLLVGDAPYYARFGFFVLRDVRMPPPTNPERVLGHALVPGGWEAARGQVKRNSERH
ncbi:MAG: N-acetyltransferase [Pseudomonadota bacterium]